MNRIEHLLTCAAEESNEVGQRACKAGRFGLSEVQPGQTLDNWERIVEEFHDLFSVLIILAMDSGHDLNDLYVSANKVHRKRERIVKYMDLAVESGALQL